MSRGPKWTEAETKALLEAINVSATLDEAAQATGRTPASCVEKVHNMRWGLPLHWWKKPPRSGAMNIRRDTEDAARELAVVSTGGSLALRRFSWEDA